MAEKDRKQKLIFHKKCFSLKIFHWTRRMHSRQSWRTYMATNLKVLLKSKKERNDCFNFLSSKFSFGHVEAFFDNLAKFLFKIPKVYRMAENVGSKSKIDRKIVFQFEKKVFPQIFFWKLRLQFLQPLRDFSQKPAKFPSMSKNDEKYVFCRKKFQQNVPLYT